MTSTRKLIATAYLYLTCLLFIKDALARYYRSMGDIFGMPIKGSKSIHCYYSSTIFGYR